ncbi:MAG TPA: hypothetical protein VIH18_20375 [Candidatus Binatia bacterium]|jgi:hypothetical protein
MGKIKNLSLVFGGICLSLMGLEIALRLFATHLPLRFQKYLPEDVKILAQSSKRGELPRTYIAVLGDSYAAGQGDWYDEAVRQDPFGNPPYHSAHVIHELTGLDVVTFGSPGAESADGIVYRPISVVEMLRSRGVALEMPSRLVIYFYEGNDFRGNLDFLARYWASNEDEYTTEAMTTLFEKIFSEGPRSDGLIERLRHHELLRRIYVPKLFWVAWRDIGLMLSDSENDTVTEKDQLVQLKTRATRLRPPVRLQAPPMWFDSETTRKSLFVLEESMRYATRYFNGSTFLIVYIPSPLVLYDLESASVKVVPPDGTGRAYSVSEIYAMSDNLCNQVALVASRVGSSFLDLRPYARVRAKEHPLHGPNDWHHFNRLGYESLGSAVAKTVGRSDSAPRSCEIINSTRR